MKRIVILCMICVMLMSAVANAEIKKDKDERGLYVCSTIEEKGIGFKVQFEKYVVGEEIFYRINAFSHRQFYEFSLSNSPISLNIDKYPSFDLDEYKYGIKEGFDDYYASIQAKVSSYIIEKIKNGKDVSLWCGSIKGASVYFLLSDHHHFLDEWKEVIATTE